MSNVIQLFPNPTDEQYEDEILPALTFVLEELLGVAQNGQYGELHDISGRLYKFAIVSLATFDALRRNDYFDDNKLPSSIAHIVDKLAGDCVLALGGDMELANKLRNRTPVGGE